MYKVRKDILEFISSIDKRVTIVAATKYLKADEMVHLYEAGISNFGENRVEDFLNKTATLQNKDIVWHFIGHLQRNKAKKVIDKINYLHSLDSLSLAHLIDKYRSSPLNCFIEVSINLEENKNGVPYYELVDFIKELLPLKNIHIVGLMMMAKANSSNEELHHQFKALKDLQIKIGEELNIDLPYLSMGMSGDYLIAISEGATHIRLGRVLLEKEDN